MITTARNLYRHDDEQQKSRRAGKDALSIKITEMAFASVKLSSRHILALLQYTPSFRIEDNVLIGAKETHPECTNIEELILDRLRSKPDFVEQVQSHKNLMID